MDQLESKEKERLYVINNPHVELEGQTQLEQHEEAKGIGPRNPS